MELVLRAFDAEEISRAAVSDQVFNAEFRASLVHQVVVACQARQRSGTKAQKSRSQARGGGRKPWRQKGTGRARAGSIRSPIWRGGGVTFAASPRDFSPKINRKMYRGSLRSIFSELLRQGRLIPVSGLRLSSPKTRELLTRLKALQLTSVLIITDEFSRELALAARNLPDVAVCSVEEIDPYLLLRFERVLICDKALRRVQDWLS